MRFLPPTCAQSRRQIRNASQPDGHRFVFPADEVRGIHRFQTPELQEPPATLAKSRLSYTQGILYWQDRTVGLLDADLLFSSLDRSLT